MNILEAQRTLVRLAKQKGVPTIEIEKEISEAAMYACDHADEATKKRFQILFAEGCTPTPAEMLMHLVNAVNSCKSRV